MNVCVCLQGKLQKHQAFEAEVQANAGAIIKLDQTGNLMINEGHFASETIRVRLAVLMSPTVFCVLDSSHGGQNSAEQGGPTEF